MRSNLPPTNVVSDTSAFVMLLLLGLAFNLMSYIWYKEQINRKRY